MLRKTFEKRENYEQRLNDIGCQYHNILSEDGEPYWRDDVGYEFTLDEIEKIESVTEELHGMCTETVEAIIKSGDYPEQFQLSDTAKTLIQQSWKQPHIYGRFDFAVDPTSAIKMYEYNADTPTSLLEAAVGQYDWMIDNKLPDQFNSIHEKLIDRWKEILPDDNSMLYLFGSKYANFEDWGNIEYMADTAMQAGWNINIDTIDEGIAWDSKYKEFVNRDNYTIKHAFKLYPYEWMMEEEFATHMIGSKMQWFEPAWKMLLSNKAILPLLWQRYEGHPNLLPAFYEYRGTGYVAKALLGREGANIYRIGELMEGSHFIEHYDKQYVYQSYFPLPNFDGWRPVIGSWVIGDLAAGMGIREDSKEISGNGSHFVPHYFLEK